jgi:carboxyl-terminal processing protease
VLSEGFAAILERHLTAVTPAELTLWTLRGLTALDSALTSELRDGQARVLAGERAIDSQPLPPRPPRARPDAPAPRSAAPGLARLVTRLFASAWEASPAIRNAGLERLLQSGFDELFNQLDPFSRYVTAEEAAAARERRIGQSGLGLRLAAGPRRSVVLTTVTPEGPAAAARLRPGDRLIEIDGAPISVDNLPDAAARLEGPSGRAVTLLLTRGGRRIRVSLLRAPVPPETVTVERRDGILWLRLSGFYQGTASQLVRAITDAATGGAPRGYVLDLRGNRGGLLPQAAAVADVFLPSGEILSTEGRHPDAARSLLASGQDLAHGRPVVVLIDGRTASSAEVVAAALSDRGRAALVGSATTGKGLVQIVMPMPNRGELLISWARLLAPDGWPIQGLGVLPNLCTSLGAEAVATSLAALAIDESPMTVPLARLRAARAPVSEADIQRLRAPCPPAEGREIDLTAARALIESPEAYRAALRP